MGTIDGGIEITFNPTTSFPKYGGQIDIELPLWYEGGSEYVFGTPSLSTDCQPTNLNDMTITTQQTSQNTHQIIFSKANSGLSSMTLKCTNYRNPTFAKTVGSFKMKVLDRETIKNSVLKYKDWNMVINTLNHVTLD